jgi:hypothetical protein
MANIINQQATPFFIATLSSQAANVTGDGTTYTAIWDTLSSGSGYNTSTGVFTAPMDGDYLFLVMVFLTNVGAAHTLGKCNLVTTFGTFKFNEFSPATGRNSATNMMTPPGCVPVPMVSGDTASVTVQVSNSTKTINFDTLSTFSAVRLL